MKLRLSGPARAVVGAGTEYSLAVEDADTGRFFLREAGGPVKQIIRASVVDGARPVSSVAPMIQDVIRIRRNAVYVMAPLFGKTIAVVVRAVGARMAGDEPRVYPLAQSLSLVDLMGELAEEVDEQHRSDENPGDAQRQPTRRGKT